MLGHFASKHTHIALDEARTIESGNSIFVFGIRYNNATAGAITFTATDNDGTTIEKVTVGANSSCADTPYFVAENGLKFSSASDADATVTVYHSAPGA